MKILVTGGTGFLGQKVAERLASLGHSVTVCGRNALQKNNTAITFIKVDLKNEAEVIESCKDKDYVIHCGAKSGPWGRYEDYYSTNVIGTKNVIKACLVNSVKRLIHISTPSLYFNFTDRFNIKESDPLPSQSCCDYSITKRLAEEEIDLAIAKGLKVITLRPRGIFGPGDTTIFPNVINALQKNKFPLMNEGKSLIDLTFVENVVDAIILSLFAPDKALGKKYNITNGESWHLIDLLKWLSSKLNISFQVNKVNYRIAYYIAGAMEWISRTFCGYKPPLFTRYSIGLLAKSQTLNIDAARQDLGYIPKISIEEGLEQFMKWWKEKSENTR